MDRILRAEIVAEVKQTVAEAMEVYNERWLTGEQLMEIVEGGKARSEYDYTDVEVKEDDKILTLSTCSYKYGARKPHNVRFIIMAKLVTEDDTLVETANITPNVDKIAVK